MGLAKPTIIEVNEGYTGAFLVPITFIFLLGLPLMMIHWSLTAIVTIFCIVLGTTKKGLQIDAQQKRIRSAKRSFGIRYGKWYRVKKGDLIKIRHSGGKANASSMHMTGITYNASITTKTFDILLCNNKGEIEIYDFSEYSDAKLALHHIKEHFEIEWTDEIQQQIIKRKEGQIRR